MDPTWAGIALGGAVLGMIHGTISAARDREYFGEDPRPYWSLVVWAAILGLALFAATLPGRPPFAQGLKLGWGFLAGLVLGIYASWHVRGGLGGYRWLKNGTALLGAAVAGPALLLLVFGANAQSSVIGCALGATLVAAVWRTGLAALRAREDAEALRSSCGGMEVFALSTVAVAASTWLSLQRYVEGGEVAVGVFWAMPVLLSGFVVVSLVIIAGFVSPKGSEDGSRLALLVSMGIGVALIVAALVLSKQLLGNALLGLVVTLGVVAFGALAWLAGSRKQGVSGPGAHVGEALAVTLLAVGVVAVGFKLLHGYGESVTLIGALPFLLAGVALHECDERGMRSHGITAGFTIVLLLALYRVFLEYNEPQAALKAFEHYAYMGLLLGVVGGLGLLCYQRRSAALARLKPDPLSALGSGVQRTALLGVLVAAAPLFVLVVWRVEALGGFLIGLMAFEVLWVGLLGFLDVDGRRPMGISAPHLYLVAALLIAVQFTKLVTPVAEGPRLHRAIVLAVAVLLALVWGVVSLARRPATESGGEQDEWQS